MLALLAQYATEDSGNPIVGLAIFVGIALIFGAWSANAAERKGIPRATGWILGLLLGIVGRIIVGVMRDRTLVRSDTPGYVPPRPDR